MNIYTVMMILYVVILLLLFIVGFILIRMQRLSRKVVGMEISPAEVAHFMEEMRSIVLDSEKIAASLEGSIREKEMLLEDTTELVDAKIHKLELLMTHMENRIKAAEPMVGGNQTTTNQHEPRRQTETVFEMEQKLEAQAQQQAQTQPQAQAQQQVTHAPLLPQIEKQNQDPVPWLKPASPYSNNEISETLNIMTDNPKQQQQQPKPRTTSVRPPNPYRDVQVHRGFPSEDNPADTASSQTRTANTHDNQRRTPNKYDLSDTTPDILYRDEHSTQSDLSWVVDQDEYLPTNTLNKNRRNSNDTTKITPKQNAQLKELSIRDKVIKLHNDGLSNIDIARELGISTTEVKLVLNMR